MSVEQASKTINTYSLQKYASVLGRVRAPSETFSEASQTRCHVCVPSAHCVFASIFGKELFDRTCETTLVARRLSMSQSLYQWTLSQLLRLKNVMRRVRFLPGCFFCELYAHISKFYKVDWATACTTIALDSCLTKITSSPSCDGEH
jgi:hypothetical protein